MTKKATKDGQAEKCKTVCRDVPTLTLLVIPAPAQPLTFFSPRRKGPLARKKTKSQNHTVFHNLVKKPSWKKQFKTQQQMITAAAPPAWKI